ncbi:MAG: CvpA family protein [Oscillospiraceae bacterium]|nr:CvpA family protein [Oscillospiraceae bacterium]
MGSQFAIVYDIIIAAVLIFAVFSGCRKGFVSTVVGMAAVFVAFFCALTFSKPAAEWVYSSVVEEPITAAVSDTMDESMGKLTLSGLSDMDYSKVKISGTPVGEITPDYAGTGKVIFELSDVDFTGTGLSDADLSMFGFDGTEDFSSMNGKTAEFTMADINANGLGKLVTAQVIAVKLQQSPSFVSITEYTDTIGNAIPATFGSTAESINSGEMSAIRSLVLTMMNTSSSVKTAVVDNIIRPTFTMMAETLIFAGIFIIVTAVLGIIAVALKLVNKIPVIGSLNGFLGGCAGFVRGILTVFIICIVVRFIITMSGGNAMLINDSVIDSTYLFKFFYGFDFLNFLS